MEKLIIECTGTFHRYAADMRAAGYRVPAGAALQAHQALQAHAQGKAPMLSALQAAEAALSEWAAAGNAGCVGLLSRVRSALGGEG